MTYRVGTRVPFTIYEQSGPQPSDDDVFQGSMRTEHMASELVRLANLGANSEGLRQLVDATARFVSDDHDLDPVEFVALRQTIRNLLADIEAP